MKRHCRTHQREKLPPNTKSVARPSRWENRFSIEEYGRAECLRLFRQYLEDNPELVAQARKVLTGHDLACYCPLDKDCHAEIWIEFLK